MSTTKNLLVELFVEELPPKALKKLSESFRDSMVVALKRDGFTPGTATAYASPRRLAVHIENVPASSAGLSVRNRLMPTSVGLDASGKPTAALLKKLTAIAVDHSVINTLGSSEAVEPRLERTGEGKNEAVTLVYTQQSRQLKDCLQKALDEAITGLPIPKVMSYQLADGWTSVNFVRPAHGLVALHGADVVPVATLGLVAGRTTTGHRFEAANPTVTLRDADSYADQLVGEGAVIPGFDARRAEIVRQLADAAARQGLKPIDDEALLDEVCALVERPNVLTCQFEPEFLEVPQECLILTMKANQKYFPLLDAQGKLTNKFLIVSNIRPEDPSAVIGGNERVVRPRLADAKFFFDQDRKKTLESRVAGLAKVVYHGKLGTQGERTERVRALTHLIVRQLGEHQPASVQSHDELQMLAHKADQAALLAKTDLQIGRAHV